MDRQNPILIIMVIALVGVIVGIAAALLMVADGNSIPSAILAGGAAFGGTVGLALGVVAAVRNL